jgi:nucleolar GTP-binding protein
LHQLLDNVQPLLIVANKIDLVKMDQLDEEDRALIATMVEGTNSTIVPMSNVTEEGVTDVKNTACDLLLEHRVERKLKGKRIADVANRIHVAMPTKRDGKARGTSIPASVAKIQAAKKVKGGAAAVPVRRTQKDIQEENGGAGVYSMNLKEQYLLANPDWKFDVIPQIMDGKNIADFYDADIEARLDALERDEEAAEAAYAQQQLEEDEPSDLDEEQKEIVEQIRRKKKLQKAKKIVEFKGNKPFLPGKYKVRPTEQQATDDLASMGIDASKMIDDMRTRSRSRSRVSLGKRGREDGAGVYIAAGDEEAGDDGMDVDGEDGDRDAKRRRLRSVSLRERSKSRTRSVHEPALEGEGFVDDASKKKARKMMKKAANKGNMMAKSGPGDNRVYDMKPKHLYSGKRGIGKTDRR